MILLIDSEFKVDLRRRQPIDVNARATKISIHSPQTVTTLPYLLQGCAMCYEDSIKYPCCGKEWEPSDDQEYPRPVSIFCKEAHMVLRTDEHGETVYGIRACSRRVRGYPENWPGTRRQVFYPGGCKDCRRNPELLDSLMAHLKADLDAVRDQLKREDLIHLHRRKTMLKWALRSLDPLRSGADRKEYRKAVFDLFKEDSETGQAVVISTAICHRLGINPSSLDPPPMDLHPV
jgi:hypothetical protein